MYRSTLILNADMQPLSVVPLSVNSNWKEVIGMLWAGDVTEVETYEDWVVHSPSIEINVPSVVMLNSYQTIKHTVAYSRKNVFLRDLYTCQYCGMDMRNHPQLWTIDHVVPKAKGGRSSWTNSITACPSCNIKKAHHDIMKPRYQPYKPDYWDLAKCVKKMPIRVPDQSWIKYLGWDEDLVQVVDAKIPPLD